MIYVHIPFCRSFCTYCDFYSEIASASCRGRESLDRFARALEKEVELRSGEIRNNLLDHKTADTLYIGGGTPSVLPLSVLESLLDALHKAGVGKSFKEFTVEVNPDDIVEKGHSYVEGLLKLGVNRISMGIQSFDDGILKWMNRRHDAATAVSAYRILEDAGVGNVSIDLIFGLPQLSDAMWKETIAKALDISSRGNLPKHISSYQLSVEPGSSLAQLLERGKWQEASEELCSRQYDRLCASLKEAGYHHYEISNFALPGYEAVHNSAYWTHVPYVGLGPGAHSFVVQDGTCVRKWNNPDLNAYVKAAAEADMSLASGGEVLTDEQIVLEKIMLGLRTSSGVKEALAREAIGSRKLSSAIAGGNLEKVGGDSLRIPESRFFVSDAIIMSII